MSSVAHKARVRARASPERALPQSSAAVAVAYRPESLAEYRPALVASAAEYTRASWAEQVAAYRPEVPGVYTSPSAVAELVARADSEQPVSVSLKRSKRHTLDRKTHRVLSRSCSWCNIASPVPASDRSRNRTYRQPRKAYYNLGSATDPPAREVALVPLVEPPRPPRVAVEYTRVSAVVAVCRTASAVAAVNPTAAEPGVRAASE